MCARANVSNFNKSSRTQIDVVCYATMAATYGATSNSQLAFSLEGIESNDRHIIANDDDDEYDYLPLPEVDENYLDEPDTVHPSKEGLLNRTGLNASPSLSLITYWRIIWLFLNHFLRYGVKWTSLLLNTYYLSIWLLLFIFFIIIYIIMVS